MSNLSFTPVATEVSQRTLIWDVFSSGLKFGRVSWFPPSWRYCYFPTLDIQVLDAECLTELATFCADQTILRENERVESALHRGEQE